MSRSASTWKVDMIAHLMMLAACLATNLKLKTSKMIENVESDDSDTDEMIDEDNLCYYCETMFENQNTLVLHMSENHMDQLNSFQQ